MKLNKIVDSYSYGYSGYGTGFDAHSQFTLSNGKWDKNVTIFRVDSSSSIYDYNIKKDIWVFGKDPTYRLDYTTVKAKVKDFVNVIK